MDLPGDAIANAIRESGLTIYDELENQTTLLYDLRTLEARLDEGMKGQILDGPLRTRAKKAKQVVAALLGYPVPETFRRTQPRFSGQDLDVFVQKSNNLQIWNEEAVVTRRYALIRVDDADSVTRVRVLTGAAIAEYDRTGTLTSKYQSKRKAGHSGSKLVTTLDTFEFRRSLEPCDTLGVDQLRAISPMCELIRVRVFDLRRCFRKLKEQRSFSLGVRRGSQFQTGAVVAPELHWHNDYTTPQQGAAVVGKS